MTQAQLKAWEGNLLDEGRRLEIYHVDEPKLLGIADITDQVFEGIGVCWRYLELRIENSLWTGRYNAAKAEPIYLRRIR